MGAIGGPVPAGEGATPPEGGPSENPSEIERRIGEAAQKQLSYQVGNTRYSFTASKVLPHAAMLKNMFEDVDEEALPVFSEGRGLVIQYLETGEMPKLPKDNPKAVLTFLSDCDFLGISDEKVNNFLKEEGNLIPGMRLSINNRTLNFQIDHKLDLNSKHYQDVVDFLKEKRLFGGDYSVNFTYLILLSNETQIHQIKKLFADIPRLGLSKEANQLGFRMNEKLDVNSEHYQDIVNLFQKRTLVGGYKVDFVKGRLTGETIKLDTLKKWFDDFKNCSHLDVFRDPFDGLTEGALLEIVPRLTGLQRLELSSCEYLGTSLRELAPHLTNLRSLVIFNCNDIDVYPVLENAPHLHTFSLKNCFRVIDNSFAEHFPETPSLRTLELHGTDYPAGERVTDEIIRLLAVKLPNLESLDLSWEREITGQILNVIAERWPNLHSLNLMECANITGAVLRELNHTFPNVHRLSISFKDLTDDGLRALTRTFPNLEYLYIMNSEEITDAHLRILAEGLPYLRNLYLRKCVNISDEGLKELAEKLLHLRNLELGVRCRVTDEGLNVFKRQRPEVNIALINETAEYLDLDDD